MENDNELIEAFWISQGGKAHMKPDLWFYESDWNMLMPVVEKMFSLWQGTGEEGFQKRLNLRLHRFTRECPISSPVQQVYTKLIAFIKWYNTAIEPF